ncbi:putative transcriptional regulator [Scheffersomyces amazonensis]|uniref:putative transcriptional regulator n=1 Tax=Scheffersomyces amazonensis TaxID=1078765 RepID=UPI00315D4C26
MYLVLDSSFETIEYTESTNPTSKSNSKSTNLSSSVGTRRIQTQNIVIGASRRSRNGCLACRKRKKKCDETYPICGSCNHRNVECVWRNGSKFKIQKVDSSPGNSIVLEKFTQFKNKTLSTTNSIVSDNLDNQHSFYPLINSSTVRSSSTSSESSTSSSSFSSCSSSNADDDFEISYDFNDTDMVTVKQNSDNGTPIQQDQEGEEEYLALEKTPSPFPQSLTSNKNTELLMLDVQQYFNSPAGSQMFNPFRYMDHKGTYFIDSFVHNVAPVLCIAPASCNYFLKTFYQLAEIEESISYAVSAWGGLFVEGYTPDVKTYLSKSVQLIKQKFNSFENLSKEDIYILLNFFLIGMGIHICAGDVSKWNILFKKCTEMIKLNGGITKICKMFDYSNNIKWIIADIEFHDVMSSGAFTSGTMLPMEEYNTIFNRDKLFDSGEGDYGLDPLQGCISSMFLLFGEIGNTNAELNQKKKKLEHMMKRVEDNYKQSGSFVIYDDHGNEIDFKSKRLEYYQEIEDKYNEIKQRIFDCQPNVGQMQHIMDDQKEVEYHLTLFDVYLYSCQLCLNYQIKNIAPASNEMQSILLNALNSLDVLLDTKLVSSLAMSLLICGITCSTPIDRIEMEERFKRIKRHYKVANVTRVLDIVREVWKRNNNGQLWIDWTQICVEKNWDLSIC